MDVVEYLPKQWLVKYKRHNYRKYWEIENHNLINIQCKNLLMSPMIILAYDNNN